MFSQKLKMTSNIFYLKSGLKHIAGAIGEQTLILLVQKPRRMINLQNSESKDPVVLNMSFWVRRN